MEIKDPVTGEYTTLFQGSSVIHSDAENARVVKTRRRHLKLRKVSTKPILHPVPIKFGPNAESIYQTDEDKEEAKTTAPLPRLGTTEQLYASAPHLCLDPKDPRNCVGPSERKQSADRADKNKANEEDPCKNPETRILILEANQMLPKKKYVLASTNTEDDYRQQQLTQKQLQEQTASRVLGLYENTAELDSALMLQAGEFVDPTTGAKRNFPPCVHLKKCMTKRMYGWVMMSRMRAGNLNDLHAKNSQRGQGFPCVICHRYWVAYNALATRLLSKEGVANPVRENPTEILQDYDNLSECEGGYWKECGLITPSDNGFEGVVGFVPFFFVGWYEQRVLPNGQKMLTQDKMIWKPTAGPKPELGETNQYFQQGVGYTHQGLQVVPQQQQRQH